LNNISLCNFTILQIYPMNILYKTLRRFFAWGTLGLIAATLAHAQAEWPSAKPITLVVPFSAGGSTDGIARLFAQKLGEQLGQSIVIQNVGGGGGVIGTQRAAQAEPDGYTILMAVDSPVAIAPYINPQAVRYDIQRDFAPVGLLNTQPLVIMGRPGLEAASFQDVIALAKDSPDTITYATSGVGTVLHLAMERFQQQAGISLVHVPYRGGAPAITDLVGDQVDLAILAAGASVPLVGSKRVKGLAVTDEYRLSTLPDVPSMTELEGFENLAMSAWTGIFAPAGTPTQVIERLNTEMNKVLDMPDVRATFAGQSVIPGGGSAADFGALVKREQQRYAQIVRTANIRE